jgi:DNA processing protein
MPGSIHSPLSKGCHKLIKDGAKLVEEAADILVELGLAPAVTPRARMREIARAHPLLSAMGHGPVSLDEMARRTGLAAAALAAQLSLLEVDGHVEALPGGRFQRLERAP